MKDAIKTFRRTFMEDGSFDDMSEVQARHKLSNYFEDVDAVIALLKSGECVYTANCQYRYVADEVTP